MAGRKGAQISLVRRKWIGAQLRDMRNGKGLDAKDVAQEMDCSEAKITRIETAKSPLYPRDVRDLLELYDAPREQRDEIMGLLRDSDKLGWFDQYDGLLPKKYKALIEYENEASQQGEYQISVPPGLCQIEPYAREIIRKPLHGATRADIEVRVEVRMKRQEILTRSSSPIRLRAVVDEGALHRQVGGPKVMEQQLRHLREVCDLPNVTLQVHPFTAGATACQGGQFMLLDFPPEANMNRICYLENGAGDIYLERSEQVERFSVTFDELCADALSTDESKQLIERLIHN